MVFKIRVVLDTKVDVIRTLLVDANITLQELHKTIAHVFGFNGQEMASFFRSDEDWLQGEEIPLCSMDDGPNALCMSTTTIIQNIEDVGEKLIYLYDYLEMWTFYCELVDVIENTQEELPKLVLSIGDTPETAPEKEFVAEKPKTSSYDFEDDLDVDFNSDFHEFESLDNVNFDEY